MQTILYFFSFAHHGKFSSYNHLVDYLGGQISIDITPRLLYRLPDRIARRLFPIWRRYSEYRLWPYYQSRQQRIFHYLYAENSFFRGGKWKRHHRLILSYHQPPSFLANTIQSGEGKNFFTSSEAADVVVVLSQSVIEDYRRLMPNVEIVSIPLGVDVGFFVPSRDTVTEKRILTVGNWLRDYELWGIVVKQILNSRKDVVFDVIADSSILNNLRPYSLEFPGRVKLLTGLSDVELLRRYQMSSELFLPLKDAVANNALLEGMACGLPVVVTDLPATREYGGEAALFVETRDVDKYVSSLLRIVDDHSLRIKLSEASRKTALCFDWNKIAAQFRGLYNTENPL